MAARLDSESLKKVTVYIGEKNYYERQQLRDMFLAQGLKQIVCHSTLDALRGVLLEMPPDLLVLSDDFDPGVFELIREIRHQKVAENPFMLITILVSPARREVLELAIKVGVDDIIIKPVTAERVKERLRLVTFHRQPFVASADYVGPERRNENPRPARLRRIPVLNTVLEKVQGREFDKASLKLAIEGSLEKVLQAQLDSQSFRLGEVCERLVEAYDTGAIDAEVQADLLMLSDVLEDAAGVAARLKDTQLSTLCKSLAENVVGISEHYAEPTAQEVDLIRKITAAFKLAMASPAEEQQPGSIDLGAYQPG